jgi:predicted membrane-bound dolichyl-phosphate-mannose-protein mannosyltransferase
VVATFVFTRYSFGFWLTRFLEARCHQATLLDGGLHLAARADAIITAGLRPELFAERGIVSLSRTLVVTALVIIVLAGFGFRASGLSAEGLSEDELNKLQAVSDYRAHGITSANGEHPFLMKALQTASLYLSDQWNRVSPANLRVAPETGLRLPSAVFGACTAILIYLLAAELFGAEVGLLAAALWAFDPNAIGFNRIAKEDTFLLFFFLLANVFWLWGQRVAESEPRRNPERYYWATAAAFGAMLASKYLPQLITITIAYYWLFQAIPETKWRLGKKRMFTFLFLIGVVFLLVNPTILLPDTWRQMKLFAGQKLVGHDGYEFMGQIYSHKFTDWLHGIPWYFYLVFIAVKLPLLSLAGFIVGLPLLLRRKLGDGRYFLLLWMFLWFMMFAFPGGKFTRYVTVVYPAVLITAAIGIQAIGRLLASVLPAVAFVDRLRVYLPATLAVLVVFMSVVSANRIAPHYRLYLNQIGGGESNAGYYFPHDEFYDAAMRDVLFTVAREARPGAHVASETPTVAAYYAQRAGRTDLICVSLSDPEALKGLREDDYLVTARGRRYFSNDQVMTAMHDSATPVTSIRISTTPAAEIYRLNRQGIDLVTKAAQRVPPLAQQIDARTSPSGVF